MRGYHGGDVVRLRDGGVEVLIVGYRLRVGPEESLSQHKVRHADGTEQYVGERQIEALVQVGAHDYWKGEQRGICRRCGVRKRDHAVLDSSAAR